MTTDVVIVDRAEARWIRLNRPDRMNAYDAEMAESMVRAVTDTPESSAAIVITGTGNGFCAGGYLADLADPDPQQLRSMFQGALRLFDTIRTSPKPVIAAVNGVAVGGGNELVVACDFAIAASSAVFGQTGPRVGSAPVLGGTNLLAMSVGEKRAKEISFLCRKYPAQRAEELGWINAVVPDHQLTAAVDDLVQELTLLSPRYLEIAKISSNLWWNAARDNFASGLGMLTQAIGSEDMREGASAFMEKRRPDFRGRRKMTEE